MPQARKRLIFIGVREDLGIEPSHPKPKGPIVSIMEAIEGADTSGTPELAPRYKEIYDQIPLGGNAGDAWGIKSHFSDCIRPRPNKPCCTLPKMQTGKGFATICHPLEPRALSIGEAKRIQTFPDDFILLGKYTDQFARIGNSVPPLFMKQIAEHIHGQILENSKNRSFDADGTPPTVLNACSVVARCDHNRNPIFWRTEQWHAKPLLPNPLLSKPKPPPKLMRSEHGSSRTLKALLLSARKHSKSKALRSAVHRHNRS
ncbi:MAG: DNA cytosine methyltransferase [Planctomycetaceae bacterium]